MLIIGIAGGTGSGKMCIRDSYSPAKEVISQYFLSYSLPGYVPREAMRCDSCAINENERSVTVYVNEAFCSQPFTPKSVGRIYKDLSRSLPQPFNTYKLSILSGDGRRIEDFIPNMLREGNEDQTRLWGNINYAGAPWVANTSRPFSITRGLNGRHLMINACLLYTSGIGVIRFCNY